MGRSRVKIGKVLFTRDQIHERLEELAREIQERYTDDDLTIVAVLKGSLFFAADLLRLLDMPVRVDVLEVSSYFDGDEPVEDAKFSNYFVQDIADRHVLVVDDILDSGGTLGRVLDRLAAEGPKTLATCVLLKKRRRRKREVTADFVGFEMKGKDFVVGYGLDYAQRYRNRPDISVLDIPEPIRKKSPRRKAQTARKKTKTPAKKKPGAKKTGSTRAKRAKK